MVETFLSGFAQGYIQERNRRLEEQSRKDDLKFKYKMDYLTSQKELRSKKKAEEETYAKQATDLANILGDGDSRGTFYNELKNGVSYEAIQKRIAEGGYAKNPNYTKPAQTVKVPAAVSNIKTSYDLPGTDTEDWAGINADIDAIDPNLRSGVEDDDTTSTDLASNKDAYVYKPTKEYKVGEYDQALYELKMAQDANDPAKIRDAQRKIEIHQRVLTEKAVADARAQGKDIGTYLKLDDKGRVIGQIPARMVRDPNTGEEVLTDVSDPTNPTPVTNRVRFVNDDDIKRFNALSDKFTERAKNYYSASGAYLTALQTSDKITQILEQDRGAGTMAAGGLELIAQLEGEAKVIYETMFGLENEINKQVASGNMEGVEGLVAEYTKKTDELLNSSVLNAENRNRALNAARVRGLKVSAAYQFAVAQGVSTGKLSNQDFENNFEQIGASGPAESTIAKLRETAQSAFIRLSASQRQLDKDDAVRDFENRMRVTTDLRARRIGDQIMELDISPQDKERLMAYNNTIAGTQYAGERQAVDSAKVTGAEEVPSEAVEMLRGNPSDAVKKQFDEVFGAGAADRILRRQ